MDGTDQTDVTDGFDPTGLPPGVTDPTNYAPVSSSSLFSGLSGFSISSNIGGLPLWAWIVGGVLLLRMVRR